MDGFSLSSSPSSEDGQVTVCPGTTVTLTCTASQIEILTWREEPDEELRTFIARDYESEVTRVIDRDPYTLTLVAVDNVSGTIADFTSTLEVMVDDIEDGTIIACDSFIDEDQLTVEGSAGCDAEPGTTLDPRQPPRAVEEECGHVNVSWEVRVQIVVH